MEWIYTTKDIPYTYETGDWCDNNDYSIDVEVYRWLRIPN